MDQKREDSPSQEKSLGTRSGTITPASYVDINEVPWWKIDLQIIPIATMMYLLNFLDRGNIGNARVAGLQKGLHMTNPQYSMVLTATFIPYLLVEIPSNLFLTRIGPHIVLPAMIVVWGGVTAFQGLVTSYRGLIACRVVLGICEGGLLPGISLYVASFYPRGKLQFRIALFFASTALAGAFSGLLAAAIVKIDGVGGIPSWAYIFILEGCFTVAFGFLSFFIMPKSPSHLRWLTVEEKAKAKAVLIQEHTSFANDHILDWSAVFSAIFQSQTLCLFILGFCGGYTLSALAYFEPTIVQGLGFTANHAQLMSVPPFAVAWAVNIITAVISDRFKWRGVTIIIHSFLAVIGFIIFLVSKSNHVRYGSLFLFVPGVYCTPPSLLSWAANNSAPRYRRAAVIAVLLSSTGLGGILATWLFGSLSAGPNFVKANITSIVFSAVMAVVALYNTLWLHRQNNKRRASGDNSPVVDDRSNGFLYSL